MAHFDKGKKYKHFPRIADSESFYLSGEGFLKNWTGDGRVRKVKRHEKYDEMWVQFGHFQRKKWLVVIFKHLRIIFGTIKQNDVLHLMGTTDRWGSRRVYIVTGIIKYPQPTITDFKDHSIDMELYKAQEKSNDEVEIENYLKRVGKNAYDYVLYEEEEKDASNNELFIQDNEDE